MLEQTLQPLLAPVVMISACGLMILSLNARVMTAKARLRQFHIERLDIHDAAEQANGHAQPISAAKRKRFVGIGHQAANLIDRIQLLRRSLMCLVVCVIFMLLCSLLIGVSLLVPPVVYIAVASFIAGVLSMLIGAGLFYAELRISMKEVTAEHEQVMGLELVGE